MAYGGNTMINVARQWTWTIAVIACALLIKSLFGGEPEFPGNPFETANREIIDRYKMALVQAPNPVALDRRHQWGHYGLRYPFSCSCWAQGDLDKAIADLTEAIRADPDDHAAYVIRGWIYEHQGDMTKAVADYTKLIGPLNPCWLLSSEPPSAYRESIAKALAPFLAGGKLSEKRHEKSRAEDDYARAATAVARGGLEHRFNLLAREYARHCHDVVTSSRQEDYVDHWTFRELVKLGKPAVPYIIERIKLQEAKQKQYRAEGKSWDTSDSIWASWEWVLDGITGLDFAAVAPGSPVDLLKARQQYYDWWEKQQAAGKAKPQANR
jgi:tetratricopeptide (TPR) repeat protein